MIICINTRNKQGRAKRNPVERREVVTRGAKANAGFSKIYNVYMSV